MTTKQDRPAAGEGYDALDQGEVPETSLAVVNELRNELLALLRETGWV
jgi:hypothetical protein